MVDAAATGVVQAPSLASSSGQRTANDTNAGPVVTAPPAPGEASGTVRGRVKELLPPYARSQGFCYKSEVLIITFYLV